jgi:hypothetical protein
VILGVPVTASSVPEWVRRAANAINQLISGKQDASANLTSIAELDLTGMAGDALVVTAGEDGFELVAGGGGSGTVTTTGTPASGNLTKFSGATSIVNGDLSGDVSTSGTLVTAIGAGKVTLAMQANMATASVVYRKTAGSGAPEVQTLATLKTDLDLTGTNSGDQTITLTGDVTGSGTGSFATTLANSGVTAASYTYSSITVDAKGRVTAASSGTAPTTPGMVLLEQHTASASASLNFTTAISATYDEYLIEFVNIIPATNAVNFWMRMSTNGGSSYDSGTNYSWTAYGMNRFGAAQAGVDATNQIILNKSTIDNTSTKGLCGFIRLYSPGSTSVHKDVVGEAMGFVGGGVLEVASLGGCYLSTTAVNAFQFLMSSGNITSGTIRVYGIAK